MCCLFQSKINMLIICTQELYKEYITIIININSNA